MPYYKYRAKKGPHEIVESIIEADNKESAIEIISSMGYTPVRVELDSASAQQENIAFSTRKAKLRDVIIFSGQLSRLIKTGVPILRALGIIIEQTDNRYLRYVITRVAEDIKSGSTLSQALFKFPNIFSSLYIAIIKAGEDSGTLHVALDRICGYLYKQDDVRSKIKVALIYPSFMAIVGLATVIFMMVFVIPKIKNMYTIAGKELPFATTILINISSLIKDGWIWIFIFILISVLIIKRISKKRPDLISAFKLNMPIYGKFLLKTELARLTASMELSLKNGIQVPRTIELALPVLSNVIIRKDLFMAYEKVKQGESLGRNLKKSKLFPAFMSNLVIIGEESGRLDEMLGEIADYFQKDTDDALRIFTSQFEPLMILLIGLVLGYIVIAMLLPIFQINLMAN